MFVPERIIFVWWEKIQKLSLTNMFEAQNECSENLPVCCCYFHPWIPARKTITCQRLFAAHKPLAFPWVMCTPILIWCKHGWTNKMQLMVIRYTSLKCFVRNYWELLYLNKWFFYINKLLLIKLKINRSSYFNFNWQN